MRQQRGWDGQQSATGHSSGSCAGLGWLTTFVLLLGCTLIPDRPVDAGDLPLTLAAADDPAVAARGPWFVVELVTGERWHAECLRVDAEGLELRWRGTVRWRVPRGVVRSLANPPGRRELIFQTFDRPDEASASAAGVWKSADSPNWDHAPEVPLSAGRWSAWRRTDGATADGPCATITLLFVREEQPVTMTLQLWRDGQVLTQVPAEWNTTFRQSLRLASGWEKLQVTWDDRGCRFSVGARCLEEWRISNLRFVASRIARATETQREGVELDDVAVQAHRVSPPPAPLPLPQPLTDDCITLWSGDQFCGRVTIDRHGAIQLSGNGPTWSGTWNDVMRIDFAPRPIPAGSLSTVQGWCFDARTSPTEATGGATELWRGCAWRPDGFDHPLGHVWIDPVAIPEPRSSLGIGEWTWLKTGTRTLTGDAPDEPIRRIMEGSGRTERAGSAWVAIDVQGLTPAGPGTPEALPMVAELRRGGWRTEFVFNGSVVSDLNHHLCGQSPQMERVWIPLPRLRAGPFTWHLQQQPAKLDDRRFDDGRIGPVGFWRPVGWPDY